jgi:serine/threonine protein kinase
VYEAEHLKTKEHFALKILNPLGYKMLTPALVRRCEVIVKGQPVPESVERGSEGQLRPEHVWWLRNASTRQFIAAYFSERFNGLRELSLMQCMQLWGTMPNSSQVDSQGQELMVRATNPDGSVVHLPAIAPKYAEFLRRRSRIFREILNMRKISNHPNVIRLEQVLELVQDSKCTIFLVLELADGGELFDRIKVDCGTREDNARLYFNQLIAGVRYCHEQGVCHRDLKPENLLLTDGPDGPVLKIADFGFSAHFMLASMSDDPSADPGTPMGAMSTPDYTSDPASRAPEGMAFSDETPLRVLKSVVGSPFYVAPEVLQAEGYDGTKADVWSAGVILYAMLAGNLPFGQDLTNCKRFRHFCKWVRAESSKDSKFLENPQLEYPKWLFPSRFSSEARSLIVAMLHPNPVERITIIEAQRHPWCRYDEETSPVVTVAPTLQLVLNLASTHLNPAEDESSRLQQAHPQTPEQSNKYRQRRGGAADEEEEEEEDEGIFRCEMDADTNESEQQQQHQQQPMQTSAPPKPLTKVMPQTFNRPEPITPERIHIPAVRLDSGFAPKSTPPPAPIAVSTIPPDLLTASDDYEDEHDYTWADEGGIKKRPSDQEGAAPPFFNDRVKRSTRFVTSVPAHHVLDTVEQVLDECRTSATTTPLGRIGKLEVDRDVYRLEVWGTDTTGPCLCAVQIYEMRGPAIASMELASSYPGSDFSKHDGFYMVEFVRGQLEIFPFKRFYQWLRQQIAALVKKDYHLKLLEPSAASPVYVYRTH